jgi:hypothetical protein
MQDTQTWMWSEVRDSAIRKFGGELPIATTESEIIDVFELSPRRVLDEIDKVANDLASGGIRSPWAILRKRLTGGDAGPVRDVVVDDTSEKQRRLDRAFTLIDNALVHYDRQSEVEDELFGSAPTGMLAAYADDLELLATVVRHWRERRPLGEKAELEAEAYMAEQAARRSTLRRELESAELEVTPEPEPARAEARIAA